jgi:hypothetical protein
MADAKDLQRRWQEIVKIGVTSANTAPPAKKAEWLKVRDTAQAVADALTAVVLLEKQACVAWQDARMEKSTEPKPKPVFRLVT